MLAIFAQLCGRNFGGSPLAGGPKLQQIFVCFFLNYANIRSLFCEISALFPLPFGNKKERLTKSALIEE